MTERTPEQIEQEVSDYRHRRFEDYMGYVERGLMTQELAFRALREEMNYVELPQEQL